MVGNYAIKEYFSAMEEELIAKEECVPGVIMVEEVTATKKCVPATEEGVPAQEKSEPVMEEEM